MKFLGISLELLKQWKHFQKLVSPHKIGAGFPLFAGLRHAAVCSILREAESFLQRGQDLRGKGEARRWAGPVVEVVSEKVPAFGSESLA